ncbi:MAG: PhzF family phenazine biosynthesis protein, partial [Chitinophagaceae bacterium]|nr:PhzF family phenazine biosynthesis protein [Chitinophagaceae bacterium]
IRDGLMQQLAMENNLAETVFFVKKGDDFEIRWFTPEKEINLCGHATLASAFVLYTQLGYNKPSITFQSQSGPLVVTKEGDRILMDFPSWKPERTEDYPSQLREALGIKEIVGVYKSRDLLVELNKEDDVVKAEPDFTLLKKLGHKVIITAPGKEVDFVSRFFAPTYGVDEDPVTGSAHSQLIPFWNEKLNKQAMIARQLSKRGGQLWVEQKGDRVQMGGQCVFYMKGEIFL